MSDEAWRPRVTSADAIVAEVRRHAGDHLLLVTGFDGVLVGYDRDPSGVWLPAKTQQTLRGVTGAAGTTLALISGRRVADLRARADLGPGVFYIGLHGLEIDGPGLTRNADEFIERYGGRMHDIATGVVPERAAGAGVLFEDKGAALAVHTRAAGPVDAVWARLHVLSASADLVTQRHLRVVRGNHVFELVPNVSEPRASAIRAVREVVEQQTGRKVLTVYISEDAADDDAFKALHHEGITVAVGGRAPRAHSHLRSQPEVAPLITRLAAGTAASA